MPTYVTLSIFNSAEKCFKIRIHFFQVVQALCRELINALDKPDAFMKFSFVVKSSIYFGGKLQRRFGLEGNNMLNTFSNCSAWGFTVQFYLTPPFRDRFGRNIRTTHGLLQTFVNISLPFLAMVTFIFVICCRWVGCYPQKTVSSSGCNFSSKVVVIYIWWKIPFVTIPGERAFERECYGRYFAIAKNNCNSNHFIQCKWGQT